MSTSMKVGIGLEPPEPNVGPRESVNATAASLGGYVKTADSHWLDYLVDCPR